MYWKYQEQECKSLEDITNIAGENVYGFVYQVTYLPDNLKYIGKKVLYNNIKAKPLKGYVRPRKLIKESNWKTYVGSNARIAEIFKESSDLSLFSREILMFCYSKKQLTYYETKFQFTYNVLEVASYLNENILGKFYKRDTHE